LTLLISTTELQLACRLADAPRLELPIALPVLPVLLPAPLVEPVAEPVLDPVLPLEAPGYALPVPLVLPVVSLLPDRPLIDELPVAELLDWSLRQVRLTRSPLLIERRVDTALPSTGRVTDSDVADEDAEPERPDWLLTERTVIVFDDSSAAMTSAVILACCLPDWLVEDDVSLRPDWPDALDPVLPVELPPMLELPPVELLPVLEPVSCASAILPASKMPMSAVSDFIAVSLYWNCGYSRLRFP